MVRKPPTRSSVAIVVVLLVAFVGWTLLVLHWPRDPALDAALVAPPLEHMTRWSPRSRPPSLC